MSTTIDDNEPRVEHTWPLVQLDKDGRPMWHRMESNPPEYEYQPRLEALWRKAQRWQQSELWREAA